MPGADAGRASGKWEAAPSGCLVPGMRSGADDSADRRQLAQERDSARHGGDAIASRPDVDGDALDAIGAGAHEIVGGPALPGELDVAGPAAQVLPRPVRVADQVREAPQPLGGKAQLRVAQQAMARVPELHQTGGLRLDRTLFGLTEKAAGGRRRDTGVSSRPVVPSGASHEPS